MKVNTETLLFNMEKEIINLNNQGKEDLAKWLSEIKGAIKVGYERGWKECEDANKLFSKQLALRVSKFEKLSKKWEGESR